MNGVRTLVYPKEMQGTTKLNDATAAGIRDEDTLGLGDDRMYVKRIRRFKHYKELGDEVIDTFLNKICSQNSGIKSRHIPSLYAQCFMDDDFNYIGDQRTIECLVRTNILGANLVLLPIGRNNH